jgi:hypothetical protein
VVPSTIAVVALLVSIGAVALPYTRRPKLSLCEDESREHSRVEGNGIPHVRALVANAKHKRSAKHARVVLDGYRRVGDSGSTRLGGPFLAWPSVFGQDSDAYADVIFPGSARPVGIGRLAPIADQGWRERVAYLESQPGTATPDQLLATRAAERESTWKLKLELPGNYTLTDGRDWLDPGAWTIRLIVGADDGDARTYELDIAWKADHPDADAVLEYVLDHLAVRRVR